MKCEKYLIKKDRIDLLSSLKSLDKKLLNKKLIEFGVKDVFELKDCIIARFEDCLETTIDDTFTRLYFERLIDHENTEHMSAYQEDIESLWVFIYKNGDYCSYYVPTEIKEIINKLVEPMSKEAIFNLQNASNTPIIKDLRGLLECLSAKDLKNIGYLLHVNRLSNINKKELLKIIYKSLTNKEKLKDLIERFTDKEFDLLVNIINNKGTIQDNNISVEIYHFLYVTGIVFLFRRKNKFYISMTDDIYKIIKNLDLKEIQHTIDNNTKVYNLLRAMVELYGIVSLSDLSNSYELYYSKNTNDEEEMNLNSIFFCERLDNIDIIHISNETYFINRILKHKDLGNIFTDILIRQNEIKRKSIELEELLKYTDYRYFENNESKKKFKRYLIKQNIPNEIVEEILIIISDMYRLGNSFISTSIEMLQEYGLEITEEKIEEIINYLNDIYNNSRIWCNNGWTPIEMRKDYKD